MTSGKNNASWKGGITLFKLSEEVLNLETGPKREIKNRLLSNYVVGENGCWNWTGSTFRSNGRACLNLGKNRHAVYKLMYLLTKGPTSGLFVLHKCDNVKCINPKHLFLGTPNDNSKDMVKKGRSAKGIKNSGAKLKEKDVRKIRLLLKRGMLRSELAVLYNVSWVCIDCIYSGKTWSHLK